MDLELSGKVAIVTAGSKGIGNAVAEELANEAYWRRGSVSWTRRKGPRMLVTVMRFLIRAWIFLQNRRLLRKQRFP